MRGSLNTHTHTLSSHFSCSPNRHLLPPQVIMMLIFGGMTLCMKNMDPEAMKEAQAQQAELLGGAGGGAGGLGDIMSLLTGGGAGGGEEQQAARPGAGAGAARGGAQRAAQRRPA